MSEDKNLLKRRKHSKKYESSEENSVKPEEEAPEAKLGPLPSFPYQRFWARLVLILGAFVVIYFTSGGEKTVYFARQKEKLNNRRQEFKCSQSYFDELSKIIGGEVGCGRMVMDRLVTEQEGRQLREMALRGLALTGPPQGGASILDLHSGALSSGPNFVNLYSLNLTNVFTPSDFALYSRVRRKVHEAVSFGFGVPSDKVFLTKPTFFSRLTAKPPATPHDQYWHSHVDKETYESFHYTALVYLTDYGSDFEGGRFMFEDPDNVTSIVEPRTGRVLMFSSGGENRHRVERVTGGQRLALTVSFTCLLSQAITDPSFARIAKNHKQ